MAKKTGKATIPASVRAEVESFLGFVIRDVEAKAGSAAEGCRLELLKAAEDVRDLSTEFFKGALTLDQLRKLCRMRQVTASSRCVGIADDGARAHAVNVVRLIFGAILAFVGSI